MALRKVETCILKATELLEAADKIKDLPGPYSMAETRDKIKETVALLQGKLGAASEITIRATEKMSTYEGHDLHEAHDMITRAALEQLVKCAIYPPMRERLDAALKEMEGYRKRSSQNPVEYPVDYAIRLCEATVAELAGYPDRASWRKLQFFP